jgi:NADH dehydrogenase FAD-containing subunit
LNYRGTYLEAEATDVIADKRLVKVKSTSKVDGTEHSFLVPYDKLVFAVGAQNSTMGVPGVQENTVFLKTIADARLLRLNFCFIISLISFLFFLIYYTP